MIVTIKDYEKIRKMYVYEKLSEREIARITGFSRNTISKYCKGDHMPGDRKNYTRDASVIDDDVIAFITACLEEDLRNALPKQNHTAKRIFERLVAELDFKGGESTVRRHVRTLRNTTPDVFIPLAFEPAEAMQIDFGEAYGYYRGNKIKFYFFCARLCYSAMPFIYAAPKKNAETLLEALKLSFEFFTGVPRRVIFDNDKIAVKKGFAKSAENQNYLQAMIAHYAFEMEYCNRSKGNEKGLVENLVGWGRRNFLVPMPNFFTFEELNEMLVNRCLEYGAKHQIKSKSRTVGSYFAEESIFLSPVPKYDFNTAKIFEVRVNNMSLVRIQGCDYSVPADLVGQMVTVKLFATRLDMIFKHQVICSYAITLENDQAQYQLEHYLKILERKPRAILNARPVKECLSEVLFDYAKNCLKTPQDLMSFMYLCCENDRAEIEERINKQPNLTLEKLKLELITQSEKRILPEVQRITDIVVEKTPLSFYDQLIERSDAYRNS